MKNTIFTAFANWFDMKFDGRKKIFKGLNKEQFKAAQWKHRERRWAHAVADSKKSAVENYKDMVNYFANIPYNCADGDSDWAKYQRPTSNGGYAAICPGERGNNVYIEPNKKNAFLIKHLTRLYNENKNK